MNRTPHEGSSGRLRRLLSHLAQPTDDWAYRRDSGRPSVLMLMMSVLLGLLVLVAAASFGLVAGVGHQGLFIAQLVLLGLAALIVAVLMYQVRQHLLAPLAQLYAWALQMCDGDFSARIVPPRLGRFAKLSFHVNRLSEALDRLANEMDDMVWEQTERLHQKNQSLELLYEIVATLQTTGALPEVMERAARRLMEFTATTRATIHIRADEGHLEFLAGIGLDDNHPLSRDLDGQTLPATIEIDQCLVDERSLGRISIPLIYKDQLLGLIRLFADNETAHLDEEAGKLLASVGQHLGMTVTKMSLDEKARALALVNERTALAYELHDSLAQTIAALRFQVNNLDGSVERDDPLASKRDIKRINTGIEAVNLEVRDLIANFRSPIDERGLLPSIEGMVHRFEDETAITVFLHTDCGSLRLSPVEEAQLLGIVREALANVRKHSAAGLVRILLQCRPDGAYRLLIEDDGKGFEASGGETHPGEHIGLSIMEDRARRLGGNLKIESEPGEGTRLDLTFDVAEAVSLELVSPVN